ncbi:MAG: SDR family NAD(P)-dependent oxidoreductase [Myxococcales bacterium]|nr:SDR family NAD(P)-dependent oxidoreductase [Myxococcales bacterium]MDH5307051.1 SDR family NAD(P)-dependent oxidoreductase [Myxococcales bacterium]
MGVTLITGASSGIGRSLARRLARSGEPVALLARRQALLDTLANEIESEGGRALPLACDVTERTGVHEAVRRVEAALGPIERLVANAGGSEPSLVDAFDAAQIERLFALNVLGVAHCIEAVLPGMLVRGAGHLVAMGSLAGRRGLPGSAAYGGAKAALTNLMESLRIDLAPRGIDVTLLLPGFVRSDPSRASRHDPWLRMELEPATHLMQRAIEERRPRYAFPALLALALEIVALLPPRLADRLLARALRP